MNLNEFNEFTCTLAISSDLTSVKVTNIQHWVDDDRMFEDATLGELSEHIAMMPATIVLRSGLGRNLITAHIAPAGAWTIQSLFDAIEEHEQAIRPKTEWMYGPDLHHIYFEGLIRVGATNTFIVSWGS